MQGFSCSCRLNETGAVDGTSLLPDLSLFLLYIFVSLLFSVIPLHIIPEEEKEMNT